MPYTPAAPGLYGQTYSVVLNEGESQTVGKVREDNLVFERDFIVCVADPDSYGGILRQVDGVADVYMWKTAAAAAGSTYTGLVFGFVKGEGLRVFCQLGTMIFAWRERYRLGR